MPFALSVLVPPLKQNSTVDDIILHYLKDPKLWELRYLPYYGLCRMYIINRRKKGNPVLASIHKRVGVLRG